jgi:hypothetical protein
VLQEALGKTGAQLTDEQRDICEALVAGWIARQ